MPVLHFWGNGCNTILHICLTVCFLFSTLRISHFTEAPSVAANHENDTFFRNGLVMGSADCINYAGLVKTPGKLFKRKLGPLLDTLQAGACVFPPFQISVPITRSIWVVLWLSCFRSAPSTFPQRQVTFSGPFLGVPSH